jgi:hypothetical protein
VLIKVDKDGQRFVSITKPERKKLTDALEFLATVEHNLHSPYAADGRDAINNVLRELDDAVSATPKPSQADAIPEISDESTVATPAVVAPVYGVNPGSGSTFDVGSNVTFTLNGKTYGGVVREISADSKYPCPMCLVSTDDGDFSVPAPAIIVD